MAPQRPKTEEIKNPVVEDFDEKYNRWYNELMNHQAPQIEEHNRQLRVIQGNLNGGMRGITIEEYLRTREEIMNLGFPN